MYRDFLPMFARCLCLGLEMDLKLELDLKLEIDLPMYRDVSLMFEGSSGFDSLSGCVVRWIVWADLRES